MRRRRPSGGPTAPSGDSQTSGAAQEQPAQQQVQLPMDMVRQTLMRALMMYLMYQYYWKKDDKGDATEVNVGQNVAAGGIVGGLGGATTKGSTPHYYNLKLKSAWQTGELVSFAVFTSLQEKMTFDEAREIGGLKSAVWSATDVKFNTVEESYLKKNITMAVPTEVSEGNSSWYAHVFVGRPGVWENRGVVTRSVLYTKQNLVTWLKMDSRKEGKNLLGGSSDEEEDAEEAKTLDNPSENDNDKDDVVTIRYDHVWKPIMPINMVTNVGALVLGQLPEPAAKVYRVDAERKQYFPPLEVNEFWILRDSMHLMNETVKSITVEMAFEPISLFKWSMYKQFNSIWEKQEAFGTMQEGESDKMKKMFIETNPVLLGVTMLVSTAHSILEVLAFKNEISHWRSIKSMEGVSVRSMIWKIIMEAIIFLYLWDNETSWMITIGNGVGLAIQVWKLGKAVKFENFGKRKLFGFIPWFDMVDRESYSKETKEYDEQAMKYLGYAVYPLVALYAGYSLVYEKHKSWYSWIINSLVGAVYAFGFIMMFPQIFINYKLKSVAHMPMKAMMYKTLNTIIDDLFSFIIKMPWLHRLACFRDDIVFVVLLYQRWIYPVDKKRVNEFGQQFDENGEEVVPSSSSTTDAGGSKDESKESNTSDQGKECDEVKKEETSNEKVSEVTDDMSTEVKSSSDKKND